MLPKCKYFGQCGGCSIQHIPYSIQLQNKLKNLSSKINIPLENIKVFYDREYNYRNRMDFIFYNKGLGLRKKRNWKHIVDIEECVIADSRINTLLKEIKQHFSDVDVFDVVHHNGTFRYAVIRTPTNDSSISFVLNSDSFKINEAVERIKSYAKITSANNIIVSYVPANTDKSVSDDFFVVKGSGFLKEKFLGNSFYFSVQGFFQNNSIMAEKMHEYIRNILLGHFKDIHKKDCSILIDLYAGVGTFAINNSNLFNEVLIIENDKNCVEGAKLNIKENNVSNAKIFEVDAMNINKLHLKESYSGKNFFVIVDPPRSGMHLKTIDELNRINPVVIIYVSCNIEQLSKDLNRFKDFYVNSVALFDFFPQTPHIEAVVELVKKAC